MATSFKAQELAKNLSEEIGLRTGLAVSLGYTAIGAGGADLAFGDGVTLHPYIQVGGTPTIGSACALIVVKPIEWVRAFDCLGLASQVYTPHEILWGFEGQALNGAGPLTQAQLTLISTIISARGTRQRIFQTANGVAFVIASFTSALLKATIESSAKYPMIQSQ